MALAPTDRNPPALNAQKDVDSLRNESLATFMAILVVLGNLWIGYLTFGQPDSPFVMWLIPVGMFITSISAYALKQSQPSMARLVFCIELLILVLWQVHIQASVLSCFFLIPILVISSVLVEREWLIALAFISCATLLVMVRNDPSMASVYGTAMLLVALTTLASWLATDNLYVAVNWAMYSEQQAAASVRRLRERRADLRRMADMLRTNQERMHYLNIRLEQAKVSAEEAYRTKQHFVANVSHELRTPLNLITGFSEMMAFSPESYGGVRLPSQYQEDVMEIYRSSKHLLGLVEDVLALAQLEAGQMIVQREWASISLAIQEATDTMRPLIEGKGLCLDVSIAPNIPLLYIDVGRIRQVLLNLLNNAYRFTEQGSIWVHGTLNGDQVAIEVGDSGVGIREDDLPRIFQEFHNLSGGPSARREGFGLGLSISRRLVEAHGGRLWADSTLGQGSVFHITLPVTTNQATLSRPTLVHTAPRTRGTRSKPVLLEIGDEPGLDMVDRYLSEYHLVQAPPRQAASAYEQYLPVAIWVNAHPNRLEIPRYLAPIVRVAPTLPIISCRVMTQGDVAKQLQADYYLAKPITRERLLKAIADIAAERPVETILIIDDDPRLLRMVQRILASAEGASYRVIEACGGQEGLDQIETVRPDLILLDLAMPEISGYDVLDVLHGPDYAGMRVALMTGVELQADATPVYAIAVQSQEGFPLAKSLNVIKGMIHDLSGKTDIGQESQQ